jgi:hypothetical protein
MVNPKEAAQNQGQSNVKPTRPVLKPPEAVHHQGIPNPAPAPKAYPKGKS